MRLYHEIKMNKITILTISPKYPFVERFYLRFRKYLKKHFFSYGGLDTVLESLIRGFGELKFDYQLNIGVQDVSDILCVIGGVGALKGAVKSKKEGKIKKIIDNEFIKDSFGFIKRQSSSLQEVENNIIYILHTLSENMRKVDEKLLKRFNLNKIYY